MPSQSTHTNLLRISRVDGQKQKENSTICEWLIAKIS